MSVAIRVSYETEAEIKEVERCLWPMRLIRQDAEPKGHFCRSYFKSREVLNYGRTFDASGTRTAAISPERD